MAAATASAEPMSYVVCDVFTDRPLSGNQLAVFPDGPSVDEGLLQPLARELNFSETVFVYPPAADGDASVRIFAPLRELPFAGHPVLGSAVVIGKQRGLGHVRLETGNGTVPVMLGAAEGSTVFGRMAQPVPTVAPYQREHELLEALGVDRSGLPVEVYDNGMAHVYVTLADEDAVAALRPNLGALARLGPGLGVNCFAGRGRRWKTRMFAPADGVAEDPATGSAAGPLACHLARHGRIGFDEEIEVSQGAELGRPSNLCAVARGSTDRIDAVEVGGSTVVVGRGCFEW